MYWFGLSLQWICVILQVWILVLMGRRSLYGRFPLFAAYIAYVAVQTVVRSAFLANQHLYFYVYWFTAPIEMILTVLAAHESFMKEPWRIPPGGDTYLRPFMPVQPARP